MRLAVINDWYDKKSAVFHNKDGILRALQVLRDRDGWETTFFKKHEETFKYEHDYIDLQFLPNQKEAVLEWKPDAILFFCDLSRPILKEFEDVKIPKAICFSGGLFTDYEHVPDVLMVESKHYYDWMKSRGLNVVRAFGTNTELFKPIKQPKIWDAVFPATGAAWKRHNLFAEALGPRGLACGWWQPHEPQCLQVLLDYGCGVLHHQNAESTAYIYNQGRTCVVTSATTGGSQRTVLEAMACNIPVIAMSDSDKTTEYIEQCGIGGIVEPDANKIRAMVEEWKDKEVNTRDFILEHYSEYVYADQIKGAVESICK